MDIVKDSIFETAERYVRCTDKSVFLTGKAGTGKTTFLKYLTRNISKRFVVLAPTGVAAINAGGTTIHSFFQLPLCPYLPDVKELVTEYQMPDKYRKPNKERLKIFRTLDLLIIDEISMVRADILDAVDMTLRLFRRNDKPFGGVQLLMIGDVNQLSPVVKEGERQYMERVYPAPYFFHSKALQKLDYIIIELQQVHRQKDNDFLEILNAVRENRVTESVLEQLNARVGAFPADDNVIRLTTHNAQADKINDTKLAVLPGKPSTFEAVVEGDFPENSYPAEPLLTLKVGARVMFVRNDPEGRFYNGKIGTVEGISKDGVVTVSDGTSTPIVVKPIDWDNIQYALDEESGEIMPSVVGKFRQLPLRIAWAVTVHKSQGLTFDRVIIDAAAAFAFGQVYVALSRCRTLDGISLDSPIRYSSIYADQHVAVFNAAKPSPDSVCASLSAAERGYAFSLLRDIFGVEDVVRALTAYRKAWKGGADVLYALEYQALSGYVEKARELSRTGQTFRNQLSRIEAADDPGDEFLNARLLKASEYYLPVLDEMRKACASYYDLEIDNKAAKKRLKELADEVFISLDTACRTLETIMAEGFSVERYLKIRTEVLLTDRRVARKRLKKIAKANTEQTTVNKALRDRLQEWRRERCVADKLPAYIIMHQSTLLNIASAVPKSKAELLAIKGFGKASFDKYGCEILEITAEY